MWRDYLSLNWALKDDSLLFLSLLLSRSEKSIRISSKRAHNKHSDREEKSYVLILLRQTFHSSMLGEKFEIHDDPKASFLGWFLECHPNKHRGYVSISLYSLLKIEWQFSETFSHIIAPQYFIYFSTMKFLKSLKSQSKKHVFNLTIWKQSITKSGVSKHNKGCICSWLIKTGTHESVLFAI